MHCRITSYINNLHPKHTELYGLIEKIIDASIPLWERTLAPLGIADMPYFFERIPCDDVVYEEGENNEEGGMEQESGDEGEDEGEGDDGEGEGDGQEEEGTMRLGEVTEGADETAIADDDEDSEGDDEGEEQGQGQDSGYSEEKDENEHSNDEGNGANGGGEGPSGEEEEEDGWREKKVIQPEPKSFEAEQFFVHKPLNFRELYGQRGRPLQVIVKLANIELTPEKPRYNGWTWHVEGKQVSHGRAGWRASV